ncbi:Uncharacterised protein g6006 [Pycnogonum litorale]
MLQKSASLPVHRNAEKSTIGRTGTNDRLSIERLSGSIPSLSPYSASLATPKSGRLNKLRTGHWENVQTHCFKPKPSHVLKRWSVDSGHEKANPGCFSGNRSKTVTSPRKKEQEAENYTFRSQSPTRQQQICCKSRGSKPNKKIETDKMSCESMNAKHKSLSRTRNLTLDDLITKDNTNECHSGSINALTYDSARRISRFFNGRHHRTPRIITDKTTIFDLRNANIETFRNNEKNIHLVDYQQVDKVPVICFKNEKTIVVKGSIQRRNNHGNSQRYSVGSDYFYTDKEQCSDVAAQSQSSYTCDDDTQNSHAKSCSYSDTELNQLVNYSLDSSEESDDSTVETSWRITGPFTRLLNRSSEMENLPAYHKIICKKTGLLRRRRRLNTAPRLKRSAKAIANKDLPATANQFLVENILATNHGDTESTAAAPLPVSEWLDVGCGLEHVMSRLSIHEAASNGDLTTISILTKCNPKSKETVDCRGMTPLHLAAVNGHRNVITHLAANDVHLGATDPSGYTALHMASLHGRAECVLALVKLGLPVDQKTKDDYTAFHLAVMNCYEECCHNLILYGASFEIKDKSGQNVIEMAENFGLTDMAKYLREAKNDLDNIRQAISKKSSLKDGKVTLSLSDKDIQFDLAELMSSATDDEQCQPEEKRSINKEVSKTMFLDEIIKDG